MRTKLEHLADVLEKGHKEHKKINFLNGFDKYMGHNRQDLR